MSGSSTLAVTRSLLTFQVPGDRHDAPPGNTWSRNEILVLWARVALALHGAYGVSGGEPAP
jgi:hypothetical protein